MLLVVLVQHPKALRRQAGRLLITPQLVRPLGEGGMLGLAQVECIKDQRFPLCIEYAAERAFRLAVRIHIVDIRYMKSPRPHQIPNIMVRRQ